MAGVDVDVVFLTITLPLPAVETRDTPIMHRSRDRILTGFTINPRMSRAEKMNTNTVADWYTTWETPNGVAPRPTKYRKLPAW